jgi:hypothetical protein
MRTRLRSKVTLLLIVCAALLAFGGTAMAITADPSGTTAPAPTIQSDQADYAPGELVTLTGSGWQAGESVNIVVNDDAGQTWNRNVDVTADASGNITDSFNLPDWFVATYSVKATGASGAVATSSFTDGNISNATIETRTAAGTDNCTTTAQSTFASGSTACAHVVTTVQGGGTTDWRLKWFAPGVNVATGTPAQDTLYTEPTGTTTSTKDKTFVPTTVGTWTVAVCKSANAGSCSTGNQVQTATFTVTKPKLTVTCDNKSRDYGEANRR